MSMNKTWPISNFSCGFDGDDMRSTLKKSDSFSSQRLDFAFWSDFLSQGVEARIAMKSVEEWIEADGIQVRLPIGETFLQPIHRLILIAETEIKESNRIGWNIA